jgi:hypothetical protein
VRIARPRPPERRRGGRERPRRRRAAPPATGVPGRVRGRRRRRPRAPRGSSDAASRLGLGLRGGAEVRRRRDGEGERENDRLHHVIEQAAGLRRQKWAASVGKVSRILSRRTHRGFFVFPGRRLVSRERERERIVEKNLPVESAPHTSPGAVWGTVTGRRREAGARRAGGRLRVLRIADSGCDGSRGRPERAPRGVERRDCWRKRGLGRSSSRWLIEQGLRASRVPQPSHAAARAQVAIRSVRRRPDDRGRAP